jgi:ribonuclease G
MGKELVISSDRHETRVAVLENDQLVEIYFQRANEYSLAGSVHKGRVTRVLPGMQSAFVDIGLNRDAFLYVSDFFEEHEEYDKMAGPPEERGRQKSRAESVAPAPESEGPSAAEHGGDAEGKERKGRRSRRRRNRGRGFPESKYATEAASSWPRSEGRLPEPAEPTARAEGRLPEPAARAEGRLPEPAEPTARAEEFALLPGESLAKYTEDASAAAGQPEPTPEVEEGRGPSVAVGEEAAAAAAAETEAAISSQERAPLGVVPGEPVDSSVEAAPTEDTISEATGTTGEEAVLDEPVPEKRPPEEPEAEMPPAISPADQWQEETTPEIPPPEQPQKATNVPKAETERENSAEDLTSAAVEEREEGREAEPEPVGETETPEAVIPEHEVAGEAPGERTANLRERGARYAHRVSRRLRRKLRGPAATEAQTEEKVGRASEAAASTPVQEQDSVAQPERMGPSIAELLREGQEILVQIAKEPLGQKGARITSHIALPGRYVVYMPTVEHLGVSRKISSDEERFRLKRILQAHRTGIPGGFIVRTAGGGKSEQQISADMMFLYNVWLDIRQKAERNCGINLPTTSRPSG